MCEIYVTEVEDSSNYFNLFIFSAKRTFLSDVTVAW